MYEMFFIQQNWFTIAKLPCCFMRQKLKLALNLNSTNTNHITKINMFEIRGEIYI